MSSHREAPEISTDPVADNTDTYAFVSPDNPKTVTIITNYLPAEVPAGGPTFFEFGGDVLYSIYIDNDRDGLPELEYQFTFESKIFNTDTFLYNNGQILSLTDQLADGKRVDAQRNVRPQRRARHLGCCQPPQAAYPGQAERGALGVGPVGAGLPARQPIVQRGSGSDGTQGRMERPRPQR